MRSIAGLPAVVSHLARFALPRSVRSAMYNLYLDRKLENLPSRRFLAEAILPVLIRHGGDTVLFVGVQRYNRYCLREFKRAGKILWTIDVDPEAAQWGAASRHIVGDVCYVDQVMSGRTVDVVVMNGVFGYGIDDASKAEIAVCALANTLKDEGLMVIGWNPGRTYDYRRLKALRNAFIATSVGDIAPQSEFPPDDIQSLPHVYDVYRRVVGVGGGDLPM